MKSDPNRSLCLSITLSEHFDNFYVIDTSSLCSNLTISFYQDKTTLYFVMEYVRNGTLFDHMEKGRGLPLPLVKNFGAQLVNFLEYIHAYMEICHRDLKPGNIMLDDNLFLKIVSIFRSFKLSIPISRIIK